MDAFFEQCPRFEDGAFHRPGKGMMADDPYMTVPYLVCRRKASGNAADLDPAIAQITGTHRRLFDSDTKLLRHLLDLKTQKSAGEFWAGETAGWSSRRWSFWNGSPPITRAGRNCSGHFPVTWQASAIA
jgi:rhamnogalacturonyl hydrolase YesR